MTIKDLPLLQAAAEKMRWHDARQSTIAHNIANADTAGFKPSDIAAPDFKSLLGTTSASSATLTMAATNPGHIGLNGARAGQIPSAQVQRNTYETSPAGNGVVLEEQLLKMQSNAIDHRLTSTIYQKNIDMLRLAIKSQ